MGKVPTHCSKVPTYSRLIEKVGTFPPEKVGTLDRNQRGLSPGITGDFGLEYAFRLKVGNYRVLFEIEGDKIIIYRILHRKDAYK